jgi:hypothetical protein
VQSRAASFNPASSKRHANFAGFISCACSLAQAL